MKRYFLLLTLFLTANLRAQAIEKPFFAIVIPAKNNQRYIYRNLKRAINQDYDHFHIYFIDDASTDKTFAKAFQVIAQEKAEKKVTILRNNFPRGSLASLYSTIHHYIADEEIVVVLDGWDWFADHHVLSYLSDLYCEKDLWMTYGQFRRTDPQNKSRVSLINTFSRESKIIGLTHLQTFKAWLFKHIDETSLKKEGSFLQYASDCAYMYPMLEMAGDHSTFIEKVLYVYNDGKPTSDTNQNQERQLESIHYVQSLPPYQPIAKTAR